MAFLESFSTVTLPTLRRRSLLAWLRRGRALSCERRALRQMDAERLDDLGLTRAEALCEAQRPFWDAPRGWRL